MRMVFGLVLLLGLGLAGFAVYMAQGFVSQRDAEVARLLEERKQIVKTVPVFISKVAIRYGDKLTEDDVRSVRWPENAVPEGAFTELEALFPPGQEPRTVLRAMEKDEAILEIKVTEPGEDAGVGSKLAPGMRAFALRVDVASGVSGFLRPGDRVDVYWTGSNVEEAGGTRDFTKLIQANIKLIAVDQSADEDRNNPTVARTVTVEATPVQVASLAQAQATGRLQLSLVGAQDENVADAVQINQKDLLGIEDVVIRQERQRCTVRTRRGSEMVEVEIACPSATN